MHKNNLPGPETQKPMTPQKGSPASQRSHRLVDLGHIDGLVEAQDMGGPKKLVPFVWNPRAQGCGCLILMGELGLNCEGCCWIVLYISFHNSTPCRTFRKLFYSLTIHHSRKSRGVSPISSPHTWSLTAKAPEMSPDPKKEAGIFQGRAVKLRGWPWL